jgi:dynein intermediate chain 1
MIISGKLIERMLCQNYFEDILQDFKYFDDESDEFKREGSLLPLWKFSSKIKIKMSITCVMWNPKYFDLFAVSIGSGTFFLFQS